MADIRILLNDKTVARLPAATSGQYRARDTELKGLYVVVGERRKTFAVQGDLREAGKRASSIMVTVSDARDMATREARATAKEYLAKISRGQHPKAEELAEKEEAEEPAAAPIVGITLRAAWERYRIWCARPERTDDRQLSRSCQAHLQGLAGHAAGRHKLLEEHLRSQQQAISDTMFAALGEIVKKTAVMKAWLAPRATHDVIKEARMARLKESSRTTKTA